jgi:hypothetical protein
MLGGRVVMVKEPVVVAPKLRSFSSQIFSQAYQNFTVKVRVDCSVRRDKFTVTNPFHIEKTTSTLFIELRTCRIPFAFGDCGLFHCNYCWFVSAS